MSILFLLSPSGQENVQCFSFLRFGENPLKDFTYSSVELYSNKTFPAVPVFLSYKNVSK